MRNDALVELPTDDNNIRNMQRRIRRAQGMMPPVLHKDARDRIISSLSQRIKQARQTAALREALNK